MGSKIRQVKRLIFGIDSKKWMVIALNENYEWDWNLSLRRWVMEPVKDTEKVKTMFAQGQTTLVDRQTGYKYSMVARCPKDGEFASVIRIERSGPSLSKVTFRCTSCFTEYEMSQEEIYIR